MLVRTVRGKRVALTTIREPGNDVRERDAESGNHVRADQIVTTSQREAQEEVRCIFNARGDA